MITPLVRLIAESHTFPTHQLVDRILSTIRGETGGDELVSELESAQPARKAIDVLTPRPISQLVPQEPEPSALSRLLLELDPHQLIPGLASPAEGICVKAGLLLMHDYLEPAHQLAQTADDIGSNQSAAYWHAIMHRREPDYENSRYWFRRVGKHPAFSAIGAEVVATSREYDLEAICAAGRVIDDAGCWDAVAFVRLCEACGTVWDARAQSIARLQEIEQRKLLEFTCHAARGAV